MKPLTDQERAFQWRFTVWDCLGEEALLARADRDARVKRLDEERTRAMAKQPPQRNPLPGRRRLPL